MTVRIPLSQGRDALEDYFAIVDDEDAGRILQFRWFVSKQPRKNGPCVYYAVRTTSRVAGPRRTIGMHRDVLQATSGILVDHINHEGLDNRRSNLRLATPQQNVAHQKKPRGQFGYYGVWRRGNRYWARIDVDKKAIHSDVSYPTAESAARARDALSIKHFGEFASLNFPEEHVKASSLLLEGS